MNSPDELRVLCGLDEPLRAADAAALPPFAPQVTAFLSDLSSALMDDQAAREYTEVTAFAFFCRRKNVMSMQGDYDDLDSRLGRGLVFHIAPGNVPMNFAYSLVAALLAGNASIVKAPSNEFAQVHMTCTAIQALLNAKHQALKPYINVIEYPRERQDLTEAFSARCDARVIWGGDETIRRVRQAELPPRAFDITFADRWSLAVLDADAILRMDEQEIKALAKGFYNDTYLYDQNACTSPRLCVWLGEGDVLPGAKTKFWNAVHTETSARYTSDAVTAVDKQTEVYRAAVMLDGIRLEEAEDTLVMRMHTDTLSPGVMDVRCAGGCFLEYDASGLDELAPVLTPKTQTVACAGIDPSAVRAAVLRAGAKGVDRIVKIGRTMDFSLTWDGYDLIWCLSREIAI